MNTLVSSQKSPLYLIKHPQPKPILPNILPINVKGPSKRWKLQADAKGFVSSPNTRKENGPSKTLKQDNKSDEEDEIPEAVFNRIIVRILVSVGAPMALGLASLQVFGVLKEQHIWDVPVSVTFVTLLLTFGSSTLGIAYGALSTSLDPDKKGSLLGIQEARDNWVEMWKEEDESDK